MSEDPDKALEQRLIMQKKILWIRRLREAGNVRRGHVLPHNDHGYTDGKHSFDALSILFILHPDPSMPLIKFMLWHDMAERYAGDLPSTARNADRVLADHYSALERQIYRSHFPMIADVFHRLTEEDMRWVRAIDSLEFKLWRADQLAAGNRHVEMTNWAKSDEWPEEVKQFVEHGGLNWERLPEEM